MVGTVIAALVPLLALLGLAYASAHEQVRRDFDWTARLALRNAEHVLEQALADLDPLMALAGASCTPETVARLQRAVYDSVVVREVGLFGPDLRVYCTNFGTADAYPEPAIRARIPAEGLFITVLDTAVTGDRSLAVYRRLPAGAGISALVAPRAFRNEVLGEAVEFRAGFRLALADGTAVGETAGMMPLGTPGYLSKVVDSARVPVRIEATRSSADVLDAFVDRLPRFGLVGLALGIAAASVFGKAMRRRLSLETELRTALRRGELEVHYQPIIELATGHCCGAEALVRWRHPTHGLVHPGLFIAMAEETGLVLPMTDWMLRRVRDDLLTHFPDRSDFHIGVNLVAQHFDDNSIVDEVRLVLEGSGLDPSVLMLEATERQLIDEREGTARRVMEAIRALGCTLALDDFGTGQSALAYLQRFPVDYLKIDKAFVDTIGTDSLSRSVLDAIIDLGHRLQMRLIAEGVEHAHQAQYLRERGVQLAQGFYFSPPLPVADLAAFVAACNGAGGTPPVGRPAPRT